MPATGSIDKRYSGSRRFGNRSAGSGRTGSEVRDAGKHIREAVQGNDLRRIVFRWSENLPILLNYGGQMVIVDGVPPGLKITAEIIEEELEKRRPGLSNSIPRREKDRVLYSRSNGK